MNKNLSPQEWANEYKNFVTANEIPAPAQLTHQIMARVESELNPAAWRVFSRLTLIHAVVGTLTLLFCPQFGVSPLSEMGLMSLFMQFGEGACMLACGAVYVGTSLLAASFLLRPEELRVLRRTEALQIPLLGLLSIGAFICFGASIVAEMTILTWLLGSILGGMFTLELGYFIRKRIVAKT